jgi:signal transduction histidine kinase
MTRARAAGARALGLLLVACGVAALWVAVVGGLGALLPAQRLLWPFVAAALAAAFVLPLVPRLDRAVARARGQRSGDPHDALVAAAQRMAAGRLEEVLPVIADVLAEGTGAVRAAVWLAVGDRLVEASSSPADGPGRAVGSVAALLAEPDTDSLVPVLDGNDLRALLVVTKPAPITAADRRLLRDLAGGTALLLRVVALNTELADRVRRADELAEVLQASRQRLDSAREQERRRLVHELSYLTGERVAALRTELDAVRATLAGAGGDPAALRAAFGRARERLDDLLERFRSVARGVYPTLLRDLGPVAALDEVAADLPRPVRLPAGPVPRLAWELESGLYHLAASALRALAGVPGDDEVTVDLTARPGAALLVVEDPAPPLGAGELRALLADDTERVTALGGDVEVAPLRSETGLVVRARVPDRVEPVVESELADRVARPVVR